MTRPDFDATTTVNRMRSDSRLKECSGFAMTLWIMSHGDEDLPAHAVAAVANALMFSMERLCEEHGLSSEGRRA